VSDPRSASPTGTRPERPTGPGPHPTPTPPPGPVGRWMTTADPDVYRAARRLLTALGVAPVLLLVALKWPRVLDDPLLGTYGLAVVLATCVVLYLAFARYRDPVLDAPVPTDAPLVSVIVPVKDEVGRIADCIGSVLDSHYDRLEVIVVDDGSTDGTGAVLAGLAGTDTRLTVLTMDHNRGKKHACLEAARHTSGPIVAFTDSDCMLAGDALDRCVAVLLADDRIGAVSGHARALNADLNLLTRVQDVWYDSQFAVAKAAEASFGSVTCVSGPLAVYRREAIENYLPAWAHDRFAGQPFLFATDRQLTGYVLGQQWIGARLKARFAGDPLVDRVDHPPRRWDVVYCRSARVWTDVPTTPRRFLRQQTRWKKSFVRNLFFNGPWIWRRGVGPALLYYAHALWVFAAPVMAFRHLIWLPLHGAWGLALMYLCGVSLKGFVWAAAYKVHNPRCGRWVYRPLMTLVSSLVLSWVIIWSLLTLRRSVWSRG
jgi:cellulose synthase/poly-beta-1,6-N-acetylglucosamine synthase-like glycosyltransferase